MPIDLELPEWPDPLCAAILSTVTEDLATHEPIRKLIASLAEPPADDAVERELLVRAARHNAEAIERLQVVPAVKLLLRKELAALAGHRKAFPVSAGTYNFVIASKMATLRRFPCGPIDWEISGVPISWASDMNWQDRLRYLNYATTRLHGRRPLFFMHAAPTPRSRALLLEREVMRGWHRMASSLAMQPEIKGIATSSWFLDPNALDGQPHLRWLNAPFRDLGGVLVVAGDAPLDSGILERNRERARQILAGEVRYRMGVGLWSRTAAVRWAKQHAELGTDSAES